MFGPGGLGFRMNTECRVSYIHDGGQADERGLYVGEVLAEVNGVVFASYEEAFRLLSTSDRPLQLVFLNWDTQLQDPDIVPLEAPNCAVCDASFGIFTWRYHCKLCGNSVCSKKLCSSVLDIEHLGVQRGGSRLFCDFCFAQCVTFEQEDPALEMDGIVGGAQPPAVDATIVDTSEMGIEDVNLAEVLHGDVSPRPVRRTSTLTFDVNGTTCVVVHAVPFDGEAGPVATATATATAMHREDASTEIADTSHGGDVGGARCVRKEFGAW